MVCDERRALGARFGLYIDALSSRSSTIGQKRKQTLKASKFKSNRHQTHCTQRNTQPNDLLFLVPRAALRFHTVLLTRRATECSPAADAIRRRRIVGFPAPICKFS